MHSITLSFATLAELRVLMLGMATAIGNGTDVTVAEAPAAKPAAKPKAEKPAAPSPASDAAASAPAPAASAPAASAPKADAAVDYPTLQKSVFKLAGLPEVGRAAATALLEQFAVKTFKDLPQDRWADALTAVDAKIAELSAAA